MRPFRRSPSAAPMPAPPPPAPIAQPAMPNPYLRNLPPAQPQQPNLSGAIGQLRAGDNVAAQNTMRQIVGLPPLPAAPQMANPSLADAIALGKTGDQAGMQRMMQQIVGLPPSGAPLNPEQMQMQAAQQNQVQAAQQNQMQMQALQQLQQRQQQQQNALQAAQANMQMRPMGPINPQSNDALKQEFLAQQAFTQQQQMGPQQPGMQQIVGPGLTPQGNLFNPLMGPQPGQAQNPFAGAMQPQQPNPMVQQFGQAQNPFARPMQPQQLNSMVQQFGQAQGIGQNPQQQPNNVMGGTQPQQPGMQQNSPMQKAGGSTGRTGLF